MFRKLSVVLAASALAVLSADFAMSQSPPLPAGPPAVAAPAKGGQMAACRADMKALCGDVGKGGGGKMKCLVENRVKTSAECQAVIASVETRMQQTKGERKELRKQARQACKTDVQTLCGSVEHGKGAAMRCLRENVAKTSPACSQALAALPVGKKQKAQ